MRICLDPGHGGIDPGATSQGYREKDLVLGMVKQLQLLLQAEHEVTLTRDEDRYVSLAERCRISNSYHADVFLSLHLNADTDPDGYGDPEAEGGELWVFDLTHNPFSKPVEKSVKDLFSTWRGVRESKHLYVLKNTQAPACLLEAGFIDSHRDLALVLDPVWQFRLLQALAAAFSTRACSTVSYTGW